MLIKVCGMKYADNITELSRSNIDLMGFIFYERSKRCLETIPVSIHNRIKKVGVFVNMRIDDLIDIATRNKLDYIQLHGDEDPGYCSEIKEKGFKIIKVFRINEKFDFGICRSFSEFSEFFLFDTKDEDYGGTGKKFKWELLQNYRAETPFLLSGGISTDDHEAFVQVNHDKFMGIDLNSKFEKEPALKDINKINTFLKKVKNR